MERLNSKELRKIVSQALAEDIGPGDATTLAVVPKNAKIQAVMVARETLVTSGLDAAECAFKLCNPNIRISKKCKDGQQVKAGSVLMSIAGSAQGILTGERVALNFVQRMSGIATLTSAYVQAIKGTKTRILDTRKTTPCLRTLEKYAVVCGGGQNHRFGLYDMVLIKDNHLAAVRDAKPNAVAAAVFRARQAWPKLQIEVEADTLEQVADAVEAGADIILLDNMTNEQMKKAVKMARGISLTEASGGVNLETVRAIAKTGVDFISVGRLTHSARAVDIALDFAE